MSYLVYSVNYLVCLLNLVCSENHLVHANFIVYNNHPCLWALPSGWLLTINPRLPCIIYSEIYMHTQVI